MKEEQKEIDKKEADEKKDKDEYEEIEDAEFFKFENFGDALAGKLLSKEQSKRYAIGLYTIRQDNGETKRFAGTTHLDNLMAQIETGDSIQVLYQDSRDTEKGEMKIFKVRRKKK